MSLECSECERDLRGGHADWCPAPLRREIKELEAENKRLGRENFEQSIVLEAHRQTHETLKTEVEQWKARAESAWAQGDNSFNRDLPLMMENAELLTKIERLTAALNNIGRNSMDASSRGAAIAAVDRPHKPHCKWHEWDHQYSWHETDCTCGAVEGKDDGNNGQAA